MPVEVILPKVDMDMSHGTLATWHVAEGETVTKGAALFDIETDKAAMEVESPASGILRAVTAQPGDKVPVGAVVALICAEGEVWDAPVPQTRVALGQPEASPISDKPPAPVASPTQPAATLARSAAPSVEPLSDPRPRATPAARQAAREAGIMLADISGSGPRGRIQAADIVAPHVAVTGWTPESGPLHVTRRKGQGVPLLMLHGFTADSQSWAPLEKAYPDRALIRIDLANHGRSPRRRIAGFKELARMVVDAFDDATRDLEQVNVLGHSLGGALALALADVRPRKVSSLVLIAPAGLGPEIDAAALNGITRATRAESLAPWLRRLTATPEAISDDYAKAAMNSRKDSALRAAQADMAAALFADGTQTFDLRPALGRLTAPTAILWGRQDHILPQSQVISAQGDFALHLLSGAGHVPQIEIPDRVARILMQHLRD
ncbi:MAG: hypothetical protein RLZZ528_1632 [Pseudomonadota bacterium]